MEISDLEFHAPCTTNSGLSQLESRVNNGLVPSIIMRQIPSEEILDALAVHLNEPHIKGIGFDVGYCSPDHSHVDYPTLVDVIASFRDKFPKKVLDSVGIKFGAAVKFNEENSHLSPVNVREYREANNRNFEHIQQLLAHALSRGLHFNIENEPSPNFAYSDGGKGIRPDPYHRWGGVWSAAPVFDGGFFTYSSNITPILRRLQHAELQLDMEHLGQTVQWGNIFNLSSHGERPQVGDLSKIHRDALRTYGFRFKWRERLFDYSQLTDEEQEFLQEFGYIIRKSQPLVYSSKLTLKDELDKLKHDEVKTSSVTPGFQVYQGYFDTIDGGEVLVIGSHLPGITPKYFKNPEVRARWEKEIRPVHALCWDYLQSKGIRKVELEPQIDDGKGPVYEGQMWDKHINATRYQLTDNLKRAQRGKINWKDAPFYLK